MKDWLFLLSPWLAFICLIILDTREKKKDSPEDRYRYEKALARWTLLVSVFTAFLFVATAVSAYFLYSTDVAIHRTLLIGQRAFVHLEEIRFPLIDKWSSENECRGTLCVYNLPRREGQVIKTEFRFTNSGNTPTKSLKIKIQCQPLGLGTKISDAFDLFNRNDPQVIERSLGAKQTFRLLPILAKLRMMILS